MDKGTGNNSLQKEENDTSEFVHKLKYECYLYILSKQILINRWITVHYYINIKTKESQ